MQQCPCFGADDAAADALAADYTEQVYSVYKERGSDGFIDAFTLTEHQFLRYEMTGRVVGPTPDGRKSGEPTCDSVAALRGKAVKGPTAMLNSAARLPQKLAMGITVLNLTVTKQTAQKPQVLRAEELEDALAHPERHTDLIVRVGGYSEYFTNLSPELRRAVVERNVHAL